MRFALAAAAATAVMTFACGGGSVDDEVVLFAASSLTDLADRLLTDGPAAVEVELVIGGSSSLAAQIGDGAPADLFISADRQWAEAVAATCSPACSARPFASNSLVLAVPAGNPAGVTSLDDLARTDLQIVVCSPEVPCGDLTARIADRSGIRPAPDSLEPNVRAVRTRLELDEADAGLIYVTDVNEAVDVVADERVGAITTTYYLVALDPAHGPTTTVVAHLTGSAGQTMLDDLGFGRPTP